MEILVNFTEPQIISVGLTEDQIVLNIKNVKLF